MRVCVMLYREDFDFHFYMHTFGDIIFFFILLAYT